METSITNGYLTQTKQNSQIFNKEDLNAKLDKEIIIPFKYITSMPGKNIRTDYANAINYWTKIPQDKLEQINEMIYNIHNASLLLDDIQDNSVLRRGIPCAHTIFGFGNTVNSANYVLSCALQKMIALENQQVKYKWIPIKPEIHFLYSRVVKVVEVYIESLLSALTGQGLEIMWRDRYICPTEAEYIQMVTSKTCCVFRGGVNCINLFSENKRDFKVFAQSIGLYWQIRDDYKNLTSNEYFDSKGYCEDITEGKFGFPIIHAVSTNPEVGKEIIDILRQRTDDLELKKHCVSPIEKCGSFEYSKQKLKSLEKTIRAEIDKFGENPYIEKFLQRIYLLTL